MPEVHHLYSWQRITEAFGLSEPALSDAVWKAYDNFQEARRNDPGRDEDEAFRDAVQTALSDMLFTNRGSE